MGQKCPEKWRKQQEELMDFFIFLGQRCTFFLLEKSFMHRLYLQNDARYILGLLCCTRETQKCLSIFLPCCKQLGGRKCLNLNDRNKTRLKHMMLFLDPQRGPEEG